MKKRKLKKSVKIILCGIFMGVISTATTIGLLAMNGSSVKVVNFVNQNGEKTTILMLHRSFINMNTVKKKIRMLY